MRQGRLWGIVIGWATASLLVRFGIPNLVVGWMAVAAAFVAIAHEDGWRRAAGLVAVVMGSLVLLALGVAVLEGHL